MVKDENKTSLTNITEINLLTTKPKFMKKLLFITLITLFCSNSFAGSCESVRYSVTDNCGHRLSFTVVCTANCSCERSGRVADAFIHSHTDSHGCLF